MRNTITMAVRLSPKVCATTDSVVDTEFLPAYGKLLENILSDDCEPERLARSICELHKLLIYL